MNSHRIAKTNFMMDTINKYGIKAVQSQRVRIKMAKLRRRSGRLWDSVSHQAKEVGLERGKLTFELAEHQRHQDIRLKSRIYNRVFTWYYYKIAEHLQYGYTEEWINLLRENLDSQHKD